MQEVDIIQAIFTIAVLMFSVVAHEVAHGYMAQYLGDPTARFAGRLTMNPAKHADLIGTFIAPIVTWFTTANLPHGPLVFGWAKPVPYNPYNLNDAKWGEAKVALAGPLTNLAIAFVFAMFVRFGGGFFTDAMLGLMYMIIHVNVILMVFNLVPIPPLDGSKVFMSVLPLRYRYIGEYLERYSNFLILVFALFLWGYFLPLVNLVYYILVGTPLQ
jgi:Zn-dependent protease